MERRRARVPLIFGGCISAALVAALVLPPGDEALRPVTRERIAAEVIGDDEAAGCVIDGLAERDIDPDVLDLLLNVDDDTVVDQRVVDGVSDVIAGCGSLTLVGPGAPGESSLFEPEYASGSDPGTSEVAAVETTIPTPIVEIASDGAAEVVWVPSTRTVRVDPQLPVIASNRSS